MSVTRRSSSSMEQGELEATPDFCDSPHIRLDMATDVDSKREKEHRKRKRDENEKMEEYEDVLKIQPPQARKPGYEDDSYKKFKRLDEKVVDRPKKKSYHERERLEKLERERKRLDNERYRHLDKIQRERDYEREVARKESSGRMEEGRRRDAVDKRDYKKSNKIPSGSHSLQPRKSRLERKVANVASLSPSPSNPRKEERKREHRRRERRSPEDMERFSSREVRQRRDERIDFEVVESQNVADAVNTESDREGDEEPGAPGSPVSEKSEDSLRLDHLHFARSKFDEDEDDEEEEEEEDKNAVEANVGNSDRGSPSGSISHGEGSTRIEQSSEQIADKNATPLVNESVEAEDIHAPEVVESSEEEEPVLPPYYPGLQGCRNVEEFHCLNRINEGTYGVVYRAVDLKTREVVALKRLKMEKEKDGFPITSLREIKTLMKAQHPNIVTIRETVVGSNMDKIYLVMDYVEHDLKSLMESMKEPFTIGEVKTLMIQLLKGVQHLHDNWIIHRDLKTSNLLLSHTGILKIGDFGLAREYGSPLKPYTPIVVTLWYRSPELLLGTKSYSTAVDIWSVGCIFGEFLLRKPLFPGKSEIEQLNCIFKDLGSPNEKIWPGVAELPVMKKVNFTQYQFNQLRKRFELLISEKGFQLMNSLLTYCPEKRMTADGALSHEYFIETPLPTHPGMFPTWPAKSELCKAKKSPRPPSGGKAFSKLLAEDDDVGKKTHMPTQGFYFKFPGV